MNPVIFSIIIPIPIVLLGNLKRSCLGIGSQGTIGVRGGEGGWGLQPPYTFSNSHFRAKSMYYLGKTP